MHTDTTGIILAGGKSERMGTNKSLLKINGKTIIEIMTDLMKEIFREVILITNSPNDYDFIDIKKYEDLFPYMGPLAGIHSGLINSTSTRNFILSCDMPLMSKEMIEYIVKFKTNRLITICRDKKFIQPIPGVYSKQIINKIEKMLADNKERITKDKRNSLFSLFERIEPEIIDAESLHIYNKYLFKNLNTPEEYNYICKLNS